MPQEVIIIIIPKLLVSNFTFGYLYEKNENSNLKRYALDIVILLWWHHTEHPGTPRPQPVPAKVFTLPECAALGLAWQDGWAGQAWVGGVRGLCCAGEVGWSK